MKIIWSILILIICFPFIISGQTNSSVVKKSIGKYKIEIETFGAGVSVDYYCYIIDTINNIKHDVGKFMDPQLHVGDCFVTDSLIMIIVHADKFGDPDKRITLCRFSIVSNQINFDKRVSLYGPINVNGVIRPDYWYCNKEYTILDPDHVSCIENWWMLKSDKTKEYDNLKTTWKIDYPNRTIIKLSEIKIE